MVFTAVSGLSGLGAGALALPLMASSASDSNPDGLAASYALQQLSGDDLAVIQGLKPEQVINVLGVHDQIHSLLEAAGIPYINALPAPRGQGPSLRPSNLAFDAVELSDAVLSQALIMFINCQRNVPRDLVARVARWVELGGNLFTTDWCLGSVLAVGFPGRLVPAAGVATGGDHNYEISHIQSGNEGIDRIARKGADGTTPVWFVEGSSEVVQRLEGFDGNGGEVLAYSRELKDAYGHGIIAASEVADLGSVDEATAAEMRNAGDTMSAGFFRSSATMTGTVASQMARTLREQSGTNSDSEPDTDKD